LGVAVMAAQPTHHRRLRMGTTAFRILVAVAVVLVEIAKTIPGVTAAPASF